VEIGGGTASQKSVRPVAKSGRGWRVVAALALVAVAVGGGILGFHQWRISRARHDVGVLTLALDGFARENGDYPRGTVAEICALLRGEAVNGQNPRKLDYVEAGAHEMNASGEFVDPWGTPYRIVIKSTALVYSCGPNRVDEQGGGDDIARE
jgi:type II secretory pathway pseudopilin PulG